MKSMMFVTSEEAMAKLAILPEPQRHLVEYLVGDDTFELQGPDIIIDQLKSLDTVEAILMQAKASAKRAVNAQRDARIAAGFTHDFGGAAGQRTLDQRSEADAVNWLALKSIADSMKAATQLTLRDADNETFAAAAPAVSNAIRAMGIWRSAVLARSWALKDQIDAAIDETTVGAIDIEAGWPEQ